MNRTQTLFVLILFAFASLACSGGEPTAPDPGPDHNVPMPVTVALPPMEVPADNPMTPERAGLGKQLFFDKRLSRTGEMSCETCHLPEIGWTDGKALSPRFDGSMNTRHTPTLYNVGYYREWYWDGRATTLESQIRAAWTGQMGGEPEAVAKVLNEIPEYRQRFEKIMGGPATPENITQALATFVRTLVSDDSAWDRYEKGNKSAVSDEVIAGFKVFSEVANCTNCHLPPLYSDTLYHNVGIGFDKQPPDPGRGKVTGESSMMGAFKTPTMRSVTETGPYFHDGRAATLDEAVDFLLNGGIKNPNLDGKLQPKKLTAPQRDQLFAFIRALTPEPKPFERPQLPE
jgi:cytochrome c peroxidase